MENTIRVLGRVRLSRDTDASTSVERQREHIEDWARRHDAEVVGWAEDVDVSGKIDPFKTPDLGPWLRLPKMVQWDALVAWKLDRVSRAGARTMNRLIDWLDEHGKYLVTTDDGINTRDQTITTEIMLAITSTFAKQERESISARQIDSQRKLRSVGRFRGGPIPFGYQTVKRGDSWYLEVHPQQGDIVREIVTKYLAGCSLGSLARGLNDQGIQSPQGSKWRTSTLTRMLRSRTLLGQTMYNGAVVRGDDGLPVMRAQPILTDDLFGRLQERLESRKYPVTSVSGNKRLLLDVIFCAVCGSKMYFGTNTRGDRYWRCSASTHSGQVAPKCKARGIPAGLIESLALDWVRATVGHHLVMEEQFFPAEGVSAQLKVVEDAIEGVRKEKDAGLYDGDQEAYMDRLKSLIQARGHLRSTPSKPARYELVPTGGLWAEALDQAHTQEQQRSVLLRLGLRIQAWRNPEGEIIATVSTKLDQIRALIPDAFTETLELPFAREDDGAPAIIRTP